MNALPATAATSPASSPTPANAWELFVHAQTSDAFCSAWLGILIEKFPQIRQAAVLIESGDGNTFGPIAVWPAANADMARMGEAVQAALGERRVVVQAAPEEFPGRLHIASPIASGERVAGAVVLEVEMAQAATAPLLRELHWGGAWLSNLLGKRDLDDALLSSNRSLSVLEALATALRHERFQQALVDLSNDLRRRIDCSRVAIGLVRDAKVTLSALSEAATFEKSSPMIQAYIDAMAEAADLGQAVEIGEPGESAGAVSYRAHAELRRRVAAHSLRTTLVEHAGRAVAVITIERAQGPAFNDAERKWMDTFAALLSPVVLQRRDAERNSLQRLFDECRRGLGALIGPSHLLWKLGGSIAAILILLMIVLPVPYRISAKTVTEGGVQRSAAAPFEGFLGASYVRAGDVVRRGQALAKLDEHELLVERAKWSSERDQYDNKLREAMASHDLSEIQVVSAQLDEAQAQLTLTEEKLKRATVRAPYDGVIVSGDLSQQIGTPLEAGKQLFEIAPLNSYRIVLQIDEREIGQIRAGQRGRLVMNGLADTPMPISVVRIMPVATAQDGKNYYRVEARLQRGSALLLPGMEGIGKIEVGDRKLGWVLFHSSWNWLRLSFWQWMP
ncbi:HlyD family efflux transporter periplasmic adaptor subunit [Lysobacter sp. CA199]|uniref:efflux RND transporter periplasmic adaptor subunit n=1 Tax=Lysobacter sp. CA199 TaxID=3455608 RepID=UPI003F8CFEDE